MMMSVPGPWPIEDADSAPFWQSARAGRLVVQRCDACGRNQFYPRAICTACTSTSLSWVRASGSGTIYSFTVSRRAAHPAYEAMVPYVVALVDLEEGPRMLANVVGSAPEEVNIGDAVEVEFAQVDDDVVVPRFRVVAPP